MGLNNLFQGSSTPSDLGGGSLRLDPDYEKAFIDRWGTVIPPVPHNAASLRRQNNAALGALMRQLPVHDGDSITQTEIPYASADGTSITLHRFKPLHNPASVDRDGNSGSNNTNASTAVGKQENKPTETLTKQPAVLYLHGGGFVSGSVKLFSPDIIRYAVSTGLTFYAPAYRLAPENPFPKPLQDAYSALEWLQRHAEQEGVDPARIAVMGNSAGATLAAGTVLMARDRGLTPAVGKLLLIYPALDYHGRNGQAEESNSSLTKHLTWTEKKNQIAWRAYLDGYTGAVDGYDSATEVSQYAVPARETDVSGLPRTYVDIGGLDLFRDEVLAFGARLAAANVELELHLYPGVPHGWEWMAPDVPVTKAAIENRCRALRGF